MSEAISRPRDARGRFTDTDCAPDVSLLPTVTAVRTIRLAHNRLTEAKRNAFLEHLSATLNVTASADAAGASSDAFYKHRRADAAFRHAWTAAIEEGYVRLEAALLDRALNGQRKLIKGADGMVESVEVSDTLGLALLTQHRRMAAETRAKTPPREDVEVVRARMIAKINAFMAATMPPQPPASESE